jgi:hypothetical protein
LSHGPDPSKVGFCALPSLSQIEENSIAPDEPPRVERLHRTLRHSSRALPNEYAASDFQQSRFCSRVTASFHKTIETAISMLRFQ